MNKQIGPTGHCLHVAIIADCDYCDKPLGGVVSLLCNMLQVESTSSIEFHLIGISFDLNDNEGCWQSKTIRKNVYRWFPVFVSEKSKENTKIPLRYRLVAGVRHYRNELGLESFDAIYIHNPELILSLGRLNKPVITHVHSDPLIAVEKSRFNIFRGKMFVKAYDHIVRRAFNASRGIIWAANACRTEYYRKINVDAVPEWDQKSAVIYSSVDPTILEEARAAEFNVDSNHKGIVTVSRLSDVKHIDFLIDVFSRLRGQRDDISFYIAGEGECRASLEQHVQELQCPDVHFLGNLSKTELAKLLKRMDAFVFASESEAMSLVALESLSCGVPVITVRVGDLPAVVSEKTGEVVESRNIKAFSEALNRCIDKGKESYRNACLSVSSGFSAEKMRGSIEGFIEKCIR